MGQVKIYVVTLASSFFELFLWLFDLLWNAHAFTIFPVFFFFLLWTRILMNHKRLKWLSFFFFFSSSFLWCYDEYFFSPSFLRQISCKTIRNLFIKKGIMRAKENFFFFLKFYFPPFMGEVPVKSCHAQEDSTEKVALVRGTVVGGSAKAQKPHIVCNKKVIFPQKYEWFCFFFSFFMNHKSFFFCLFLQHFRNEVK